MRARASPGSGVSPGTGYAAVDSGGTLGQDPWREPIDQSRSALPEGSWQLDVVGAARAQNSEATTEPPGRHKHPVEDAQVDDL